MKELLIAVGFMAFLYFGFYAVGYFIGCAPNHYADAPCYLTGPLL